MSAPTYLELKLFLPVDVYNATLSFIGERMRDINIQHKDLDVKSLSSTSEFRGDIAEKPYKAPKTNLRELVENNCECARCFKRLCNDHTSPWHRMADEENELVSLRNVKDGRQIFVKDLCENLVHAIEEIPSHVVGFVCHSRMEMMNTKDATITSHSARKLKLEQEKVEITQNDMKFKRAKYNKMEDARNVSLALDKHKLHDERLKTVESKLVKEHMVPEPVSLPKSLVTKIRNAFNEELNYQVEESGYFPKWNADARKKLQLNIKWIGPHKQGFSVQVERRKTDEFRYLKLDFILTESRSGKIEVPNLEGLLE